MNRKKFLRSTAAMGTGMLLFKDLYAGHKDPVYGHNGMRYRMNAGWGKLDNGKYPVKDCHEMVMDKKNRIILLGNETSNNVLVYDKSGKLLDSWGHNFPGGHGLTLADENDEQFLFITDTDTHQVFKTTMGGKILLTINAPRDLYSNAEAFKPTEVTVDTNGDFYVADGYGEQYILHYDSKGNLKSRFGGKGEGVEHLDNAHGITIDRRKAQPTILVTDRTRTCFKRFTLDGKYLEGIQLPGACVCRPVIRGNHLYAAVLRSPDLSKEGSGFVTVLDKDNKVVSNIGGTEPVYTGGVLQPMAQKEKIFVHPHDVCVDDDDNLYVAQWASGKVYPYKFTRV
ncbi:MAG: 6-bladed beta-propeller [Chitinophagaceae bacterium]|nr:MAG: 6-bladed beta-propeller [Chitinophagaceae bacterium]